MDAPTGTWPLSAAATALLQDPRIKSSELLRLAVKELVLRRVWRIEEGGRTWTKRRSSLALYPGDRPVPPLPPLPLVDEALRGVVPGDGGSLTEMVRHMLSLDSALPQRVRDDALDELRSRALLTTERRRTLGVFPRTVTTQTLSGDSWLDAIDAREADLRSTVGRTDRELAAEMAALGGLILVLAPDLLAAVKQALKRPRAELAMDGDYGGSGGAPAYEGDGDFDLEALDGTENFGPLDFGSFDSLDSSFDSAVGTGLSDGGGGWGGGDGGGGGGGDGGGN